MVKRGDVVLVCVSGGKDSTTVLHILSKYSRELGIKVIALTVIEGIRGRKGEVIKVLKRFCEQRDLEYHVVSFREYFGFDFDEVVAEYMSRGLKPCTVCGVFRRYIVNRVARELGATKVATGHNLDDEVQVFLMNLIRGNLPNLVREGQITEYLYHEKFVPRIKPLYYCLEAETAMYAVLNEIYVPWPECPYAKYSGRYWIRKMVNKLEITRPGTKWRLLAAKHFITYALRELYREYRLSTCKYCGEPTSGDVCKVCELRSLLRR